MIEEMAKVVAVESGYAWVETKIKTTCGACVAQDNCGTGLVAKTITPKSEHIKIATPSPLNVGQWVKIGIPETQLLFVSALVYVVPLLSLIIAAALSASWQITEPLMILFSFTCTFISYYLVSRFLKRRIFEFSPIFLGASNEASMLAKHEIPIKKL